MSRTHSLCAICLGAWCYNHLAEQMVQRLMFVTNNHKTFLQEAFFLSMLSTANFSWVWRHRFWSRSFFLGQQPFHPWRCITCLTKDGVTAASRSWQDSVLMVPDGRPSELISYLFGGKVCIFFQMLARCLHLPIARTCQTKLFLGCKQQKKKLPAVVKHDQ